MRRPCGASALFSMRVESGHHNTHRKRRSTGPPLLKRKFIRESEYRQDPQEHEPTCYAFARKLTASQKRKDCPPLFEPQRADKLAALQEIVIDAPAMG